MKTLILYSSRDGQTRKIAQFIAQQLTGEVVVEDLHQSAVDISSFSRVIIGASIRYGHFNKKLYEFIKKHSVQLNQKNTAFFGVNLTARKEDKNTPETNTYVRKFLQYIEWKPDLAAVFAGALCYPRYNFFDRIMIQFIMTITKGETDPTKEIEYTDWEKVRLFSLKIAQLS